MKILTPYIVPLFIPYIMVCNVRPADAFGMALGVPLFIVLFVCLIYVTGINFIKYYLVLETGMQ